MAPVLAILTLLTIKVKSEGFDSSPRLAPLDTVATVVVRRKRLLTDGYFARILLIALGSMRYRMRSHHLPLIYHTRHRGVLLFLQP